MPIDFQQARFAMVEQQVRPWDVLDPRVLETLMTVRRDFLLWASMDRSSSTPLGCNRSLTKR